MSDYYVKNSEGKAISIRELIMKIDTHFDDIPKKIEGIDTRYTFRGGQIILSGNPEEEAFLGIYPNSTYNHGLAEREHKNLKEKIQSLKFVLEKV